MNQAETDQLVILSVMPQRKEIDFMDYADLIKAGYTQHGAGFEDTWANCLFQKRFTEGNKVQYFINIYHSTVFCNSVFTAKVQMYRGHDTFDLSLHEVLSPEHAEKFFAEIWGKMGMDFDHHN